MSVGTCIDEEFCNEKADGYYRNPDTCFGYIACSGGIAHEMRCAEGLMFNKDKNVCDDPENTKCEIQKEIRGTTMNNKGHFLK